MVSLKLGQTPTLRNPKPCVRGITTTAAPNLSYGIRQSQCVFKLQASVNHEAEPSGLFPYFLKCSRSSMGYVFNFWQRARC